jgi:hypothetical protein
LPVSVTTREANDNARIYAAATLSATMVTFSSTVGAFDPPDASTITVSVVRGFAAALQLPGLLQFTLVALSAAVHVFRVAKEQDAPINNTNSIFFILIP